MKLIFIITPLFILFTSFSCTSVIRTASRPELAQDDFYDGYYRASENVHIGEKQLSDQDLEKYAYELGLDPKQTLSADEKSAVLDRRRLRQLERSLDSETERINYSKVLPLLQNDKEKISYLSIPSIEGRQAWVNRNKIWSRSKSKNDYLPLVETQDIAIGMTQDLVRRSWGDPTSIENSGNPIYKNERWKYIREMPTVNGYKREKRYVYFEGGKVVGWETEQ